MKAAIFFFTTVIVCLVIGGAQRLLQVNLPLWANYTIGAVFAAPLISWISGVLDRKYRARIAVTNAG